IPPTHAKIGVFELSSALLKDIDGYEAHLADARGAEEISSHLKTNVAATEEGFYVGNKPAFPQIGETRIRLEVIPLTNMSVVARQHGNLLDHFESKSGGSIGMLVRGTKSSQEVFGDASFEPAIKAWSARL